MTDAPLFENAPEYVTLLDPPETPGPPTACSPSPPPLDGPTPLQHPFRHAGWSRDRDSIYRALCSYPVTGNRQEAFATCGTGAWLLRDDTDPTHFKIATDRCHDRLCVPCQRERSRVITDNLLALLPDHPLRMVTLTIRASAEPLRASITALYRWFRILRRRPFWKHRITGGCAFLELTYNHDKGTWHPHLHVLCDGRYLPQPVLSAEWLAITGDSFICDVRLVRNKNRAAAYVAKYATKSLPPGIARDRDLLHELIFAISGRRMLVTFGTWAHWKLTRDREETGFTFFSHVNDLRFKRSEGDTTAAAILKALEAFPSDNLPSEFHIDLPPPKN